MKVQFRLMTKRREMEFKLRVPTSWFIILVMGDINLIVQFILPYFS